MNSRISERLWGYSHAFDHPVTLWLTVLILGIFAVAIAVILVLGITGKLSPALRRELWLRTASWGLLAPVLLLPVLAGAFWTILAVAIIALWCNREYAWATGLFREKLVSATTVLGIVMVYFAVFDHWYGFFVALIPLSVVAIAAISIPLDRPQGYVQRTGLAILGFLLFGVALGHLAYMANDMDYRPVILMVLVAVSLNDIFAFTVGKTLGGPRLLPQTSPNKTISGSLGALVLTTIFVTIVSGPVFAGSVLEGLHHRIAIGAGISVLGQLGDLMLSSIKRDIGIKDMGATIPGHGGVLDRFNSLLLVAPALFHYVGYFRGFGLSEPTRIMTGG
jgi:phosphatidate cytidylyltransferase